MTRKRRSKINPTFFKVVQEAETSKKWKYTNKCKYTAYIKQAEDRDKLKCDGVEI